MHDMQRMRYHVPSRGSKLFEKLRAMPKHHKIREISKYVRDKMTDLILFLSSFSIPFIYMLSSACKGNCANCGLCAVLIPIVLTFAYMRRLKQKLVSLANRMKKSLHVLYTEMRNYWERSPNTYSTMRKP